MSSDGTSEVVDAIVVSDIPLTVVMFMILVILRLN